MLYADKRALQTNLKVSLLAIRERELTFYTNNSLAIGTQAAMFAGFAFAGLTQPLPEETSVLRALFLVCNVSALGAGPPFTATFARLSPQLLPLSARRALSARTRAPPSPCAHAPRPPASGLELIAMVSTTLLSMLAPGLALRGPDGSMHTAVDGALPLTPHT